MLLHLKAQVTLTEKELVLTHQGLGKSVQSDVVSLYLLGGVHFEHYVRLFVTLSNNTRKHPTAWSFAKHTWQPRDTSDCEKKSIVRLGFGDGRPDKASAMLSRGATEKKALQLGKCWLDVYGIPKWSQIEIQKVPKCPKIFQIASHQCEGHDSLSWYSRQGSHQN